MHHARSLLCAAVLSLPLLLTPAHATEVPPPDAVARLKAYDPQKDDLSAVLQALVPKLAPFYLKLGTNEIQKGGPLSQALGPATLAGDRLDEAPGKLPMVVYKKEDGRLPAAFMVARFRGVLPNQICHHLSERAGIVLHPLVSQYFELAPAKDLSPEGWGDVVKRQLSPGFSAVDMPFGAGLFGLRPSYVFADWDVVELKNGVCIASLLNRPGTAEEKQRMAVFKDKKGKERKLEDDYYEAREYRLTSLFMPERDQSGQVKNSVLVYFVRIVPALKPGTDLVGSGALARWIFARGAEDALVKPVKLMRDEVARRFAAAGKAP